MKYIYIPVLLIYLLLTPCACDNSSTAEVVSSAGFSGFTTDPLSTVTLFKKFVKTRSQTTKIWWHDKLAASTSSTFGGVQESESWSLRLNHSPNRTDTISWVEMIMPECGKIKTMLVYQYLNHTPSIIPGKGGSVLVMLDITLEYIGGGKWSQDGTCKVERWVGDYRDVELESIAADQAFKIYIDPTLKQVEELLK